MNYEQAKEFLSSQIDVQYKVVASLEKSLDTPSQKTRYEVGCLVKKEHLKLQKVLKIKNKHKFGYISSEEAIKLMWGI